MITKFLSKYLEFLELLICVKIAGVISVWTKWEEKWQRHSNTKNAFRCQILLLRDGGAYVSCKMSKVKSACKMSKVKKGKSLIRVKSYNLGTKSLKVRALLAGVVKVLACKPTVSSYLFLFYLFVYSRHEVHSMNTHTLQNAGWKIRQYRTEYKTLKPAKSQGYRHFLQLHWRQNHRVTDTFLTLLLANT